MSYEAFRRKVNARIASAGCNFKARFVNDTDKGRFLALLPDGTWIVGNPLSAKVTFRQRNHTYEPVEI